MLKHKFEVTTSEYEKIKAVQFANNNPIQEHAHGTTRSLYVKNRLIAVEKQEGELDLGDITQGQFISFLGLFKKNLYLAFEKKPDLYNLKIEFKGVARQKNNAKWDSMKIGCEFVNIDLNSAYWQIAYKLGYIDTRFFEDYQDLPAYKQVKRYCISFLARRNKKTYWHQGESFDVYCENSCFQRIYDNIRNDLYLSIQESLKGISDWIEYNIDGVLVPVEHLEKVKRSFIEQGLTFKITHCEKVSETQYRYANKTRNFKINKNHAKDC